MEISIHRIRLGFVNSYLVCHSGMILVDTGMSGSGKKILQTMRSLGYDPQQLNLIVLTHGHADHIGSACDVAEATGAQIAIHQADQSWLAEGRFYPAQPVTAWARWMARLTSRMQAQMTFEGCVPDFVLDDGEFQLEAFGIPGKVVPTPGHTPGSVSVILEDGSALVGDMAMNGFPSLKFRPDLPFAAQDMPGLVKSWQKLLGEPVRMIYPGHGSAFPAGAMRKVTAS